MKEILIILLSMLLDRTEGSRLADCWVCLVLQILGFFY